MVDESKPVQKWTVIEQGVSKALEAGQAVVSNAFEIEDEFRDFYAPMDSRPQIIQPPYDLKMLERLSQENNTLPACIQAMVDNVDGTGYTFEGPLEDEEDDTEDPKIEELENTFSHIGIDESFISLRKKKRRDEEQTGNAYWEFIRNLKGDVVFIRHVEAKMVRLVKLDEAVPVEKEVTRLGTTFTVTVSVRERRYAQIVSGKTLVYFREFGSSRHLNKKTGEWETPEKPVKTEDRATELMHFRALPDAHTPYGVPRWISQLPSVLGSRKAEEFNLEFFNNGGVPPAIIFLQGGTMTAETKKGLEQLNVGGAIRKHRLAVLELESTDGSLDKGGASARATVERFGADRQSDSMFEAYDDKCAVRLRRAFRLAPLFLGAADDYNFATSHTSYMVTEQQVFKPERDEFDEIMSIRVLPSMGHPDYRMVSKPLVLKNAENLLNGVNTAKDIGGVSNDALIEAVNEAAGTRFKYNPEHDDALDPDGNPWPKADPNAPPELPLNTPGKPLQVIEGGGKTMQKSDNTILWVAVDLRDAITAHDAEAVAKNLGIIAEMTEDQREDVRLILSKMLYLTDDPDDMGLSELAGCGVSILAREVTAAE